MASALALELTQLRWDLGTSQPYFIPVLKVSSLTADYFKMQVFQLNIIIREGWEQQIRANKKQKTALTSTVIRINGLYGESFFSYYDKTCQAGFEDQLLSAKRKKLSNLRNRPCISEIIDVSQLNSRVLFHHGLCPDARSHFEEWLKSDNGDW